MPLSAVEKASKRYRDSFEKGLEPPPPRTAVNAALLEEVRAEVKQSNEVIRVAVCKGVKRVHEAVAKGQLQLEEKSAVCQRLLEEKAACLVASFAAGSSGAGSCSGADASDAKDGSALRQQIALPTSTDQQTLPPEVQMLAIHAPREAWALELEARRRECDLRFEAAEARCVALKNEEARLAPEELRHFRQTYELLAVQHAWPALPEGPALPVHISNSLGWFFREDQRFRVALYAKMKSAMPKEGIKPNCSGCQHNVEKLGGAPHTDLWTPGSWDLSCARHKVLSAVNETRCEVALRIEWAEQALQYAAASQQQATERAERLRLASVAREAEARQERKRRRSVEDQARREINPEASKCQKCEDADFVLGGLCAEHQEELRIIAARLSEESVVPLSGSAAESCDSE